MSDWKEQVVHRSGALKQQNKSHKHGRHKSKGEINSTHKGRVSLKAHSKKGMKDLRKADRRNQRKLLRTNKRQAVVDAKRGLGTVGHSPHLLVVIPLHDHVDTNHIHSLFCQACGFESDADTPPTGPRPPTLISHALKHRFTFVYPSTEQLYSLLDIAKVADTLLLVYGGTGAGEGVVSPHGSLLLDCLMAQGLPTVLHLAQGLGMLTGKAQAAAKRAIQRNVSTRFPSEKVHQLDTLQQARGVLRTVSTHKRRPVLCRDQHPYLLVDHLTFHPYQPGPGPADEEAGEEGKGTLLLSGYVRSRALSVNSLLHIPGLGDFQMSQIDSPKEPEPLAGGQCRGMAVDAAEGEAARLGQGEGMEEDVKVLEVADPTKQASLQSEVTPDPMAADQTWPSEQELREAEAARREKKVSKRVPKGTSEYQAAWILDSDSEQEGEEEEDSDMDEGEEPVAQEEAWSESEGEEFEELCTEDTGTVPDTDQYDADVDMDAEKEQLERLRSEREHVQFPDEVDTPTDCLAKTRFQKYRGLKSFRSSPWNPLENLPPDYARIFQFENFSATKKRVLRQKEEEGALPGWYVTVHVSNVPKDYAGKISSPLVVFGLLPHENKMSVLHYVVRRTSNYTLPIKSKDRLVFHTGLRRYSAQPIFSQHSAGDKHKFERFLPSDGCYVASVYAPISYPPQPLLLFLHQEMQGGGERSVLVGTGSLSRVQPQRVICKRIVLSGHPYKINKKAAVIRYMFFNRDDILWYKPVELRTKYGRRGHIKEPLGTHGHMKCVFDGQLKAQDTVLMYLYKRVYPKWGYCSDVPAPVAWQPRTNNISHEPDQNIMED